MANNPLPYDASVIASVNAFTALLNTGFLEIWSGAQPALNAALTGTKLAKLPLSATAFATATAAAGVVTALANAITAAAGLTAGTAGYFSLMASNDTTVVLSGSVGTAGADLNLSSLSITTAQVSITSFSVTEAES